jgi:hypothetical protein
MVPLSKFSISTRHPCEGQNDVLQTRLRNIHELFQPFLPQKAHETCVLPFQSSAFYAQRLDIIL